MELSLEPLNESESLITKEDLLLHTQVLASSEFQGRFPASEGERKTIDYLISKFKELNAIVPGNTEDNSFTQSVPLVELTRTYESSLSIRSLIDEKTSDVWEIQHYTEFVSQINCAKECVSLTNSELVFCGYGIIADEFEWNDFKGKDMRGKTIICFVNDPGLATSHLSSPLFRGKNMTYYGRWTYKFEEAVRQRAAGIFLIHTTESAGYPWSVVADGRLGAYFKLASSVSENDNHVTVQGWITEAVARRLFQRAGLNYEEMKVAALSREFQPISLKQTCSLHLENKIRTLQSHNVLARLEGSTQPDEVVIYSAHWDHLGVKMINNKEEIMYGARDNALSVAALLTLAKAFSRLPREMRKRSILFFMATAEEQGLLGSFHYTHSSLFSPQRTVACINFDILNIFGRMRDISFYGSGQNELEDLAQMLATKKQQRIVTADPTPENGMYYRSDHFPFALKGVPALFFNQGFEHFQHGREWTLQRQREWTAECYHKTMDRVVVDPSSKWCWDLNGTVDDIKLAFAIGVQLISSPNLWPKWKDSSEFKKIRDSQHKD